jgi:hypothetical protein
MADRVLFISWSAPVRGMEERSVEVFNEALGYYGRMQQDGHIESFEVVLLAPNGGLNGYIELRGSAAQLAAAREDTVFRRLLVEASMVVDGLRTIDGYCNEGIAEAMNLFQEAVAGVPQR